MVEGKKEEGFKLACVSFVYYRRALAGTKNADPSRFPKLKRDRLGYLSPKRHPLRAEIWILKETKSVTFARKTLRASDKASFLQQPDRLPSPVRLPDPQTHRPRMR